MPFNGCGTLLCKMPRAAFTTLGCKVNQYETQRILESFEGAGFEIVPFNAVADVYVINTCSVTGQAESKSRQTVRRAARQNPDAKIVVTGCAAQMSLNRSEAFDAADLLVPNPVKLETLNRFLTAFPSWRPVSRSNRTVVASQGVVGRTRATVKIQDGCSVMCSYCSIPYTRPGLSSRSYPEVITEIRQLAERGYKEVVLTGVLIGAYGKETGSGGPNFEDLIELIQERTCIDRLRISSIEMRQVTPRLLEIMRRAESKVVPHLHIPLQAGSTRVLSEMNRPYSKEDYLELCRSVYAMVPDVAITADIMVGFPTETEEDFLETVDVCEQVRYAKTHLFRFSPRHGTPADKWGDAIPPQEKQRRSSVLNELSAETRSEFVKRFCGRRLEVLVECKSPRDGLLRGHTGNYIEVEFPGPSSLLGSIVKVEIVGESGGSAIGELSSEFEEPSLKHLNVLN